LSQFLKEIEKQVREILPEECLITKLDLEGPDIVIYTANMTKFIEDDTLIKKLASQLKKRFILRSEPAQLMSPEQATDKIKEIVPQEANIISINFNPEFCEVNIEAEKLGLIIGHGGQTLKKITQEIGWRI